MGHPNSERRAAIIWVEGGHGSLPEETSSRMLKWLQEKIK
jgi:hypothetical protein